jgi:TPR repeat protein
MVTRDAMADADPHMQALGEGSKHYQHRQMVSFGVGFLAAAGLSWLFWNGIRTELRKPAPGDAVAGKSQGLTTASVAATAATAAVAAPSQARMAAEAAVTLKDVFSLDKVSPRGRSAVDVDLTTALRLADEGLHGAAADRQESAFWLRKSLSLVLNQDEVKWALTQLGSTYAAPASGPPDYTKARLIFELAASQGDPVANCFLGSLHELGYGVVPSKSTALAYFTAAKAAGGCRGGDEAIGRLSQLKE